MADHVYSHGAPRRGKPVCAPVTRGAFDFQSRHPSDDEDIRAALTALRMMASGETTLSRRWLKDVSERLDAALGGRVAA